ncbi:MAG TPA: hypothetical protein VFJ89_10200 [Nocardioides sp.]|jgi:hypothetical protein|nr:hypothetical protein [Nocardioides sp.]
MSAISKASERLEEAVELLENAITAMFMATVLVVLVCVTILLGAGTFAVLHPGNDFGESGVVGSGGGGDIILPAQPF